MYNGPMKGRNTLKGRSRFSDAPNSTDLFRSAALEPARAPRRKQNARIDTDAADRLRAWDCNDTAVDPVAPHPRR